MAERIASSEMNRRPGALIDRAAAGEVIELTRHGRVVAVLAPTSLLEAQAGIVAAPMKSGSSSTGSAAMVEVQATPTDASAASRRPAPMSDPLEASRQSSRTAQQERDALLRGSRRG